MLSNTFLEFFDRHSTFLEFLVAIISIILSLTAAISDFTKESSRKKLFLTLTLFLCLLTALKVLENARQSEKINLEEQADDIQNTKFQILILKMFNAMLHPVLAPYGLDYDKNTNTIFVNDKKLARKFFSDTFKSGRRSLVKPNTLINPSKPIEDTFLIQEPPSKPLIPNNQPAQTPINGGIMNSRPVNPIKYQ